MNRLKYRVWITPWGSDTTPYMHYIEDLHLGAKIGNWERGGYKDAVFQQYTGLKDKNGKEIYEGDICNAGMVTGPIDFIIGGFSLASNPLIEFLPKYACIFSPDYDPSWIDVEVVGNVCENPDYFKNNE
jgi:hypothetical protein